MITYEYYKKTNGIFVETDLLTIGQELKTNGINKVIFDNIRIESNDIILKEFHGLYDGDLVNLKNIVPNTAEHVLKGSDFVCGFDRDQAAQAFLTNPPEFWRSTVENNNCQLVGDGSGQIKVNGSVYFWTPGPCTTTYIGWSAGCNPNPWEGRQPYCPITESSTEFLFLILNIKTNDIIARM